MKKLSIFFLVISTALLFSSCSKEMQIENNLTSQSGRWNIDNYKITITTTGLPPVISESGDLGYMYFFDNYDGQILFIYDVGDYNFIEFEWEATEGGVIISYNNEDFEYSFTTNDKDRIVMYRSETVALTDSTSTTTEEEYELLRIE